VDYALSGFLQRNRALSKEVDAAEVFPVRNSRCHAKLMRPPLMVIRGDLEQRQAIEPQAGVGKARMGPARCEQRTDRT